MAVPDRYRWAVDILDVQPNDNILEIGCGYGHSIPLICEKLSSGSLTAIDRSEKMAAAAIRSNKQFIASGKASVLHQDLLDSALPASQFDKIFLFNINVFWMDPSAELAEIRRLLKPGGRFYLFHQPPPGHDLAEFEVSFARNFRAKKFEIEVSMRNSSEPIRSLSIVAREIFD